ncbi:MAG: cytochrome c3 family protein [Desulfobulbaceae bacterium]|nr:cytochrome c3 family protein [Desulfobulbaceae bacterium]
MKSIHSKTVWLSIWGVLIFATMLFASCEGPAGKDGLAGKDGKDGKDGADGTQNCGTCHDASTDLFAKQLQWAASDHATNTSFERSGASCAACHTSDGFREVAVTGESNTAAAISNPTGQNCRTCHTIHETYTNDDYKLTYEKKAKLRTTGVEFDFGKGSLCAQCHQARTTTPALDLNAETYTLANFRFGPHYGAAANVIAGSGAFELAGSLPYANTGAHQNIQNSCVSCHMGTAYGNQAGGHTMKMKYSYNSAMVDNVAVCTPCHSSAKDFNISGYQSEMKDLATLVRKRLLELDMITPTDGVDTDPVNYNHDYAKVGTYPSKRAAALYNYIFIMRDKSWGIHNPRYTKAVLQNALEALN